MTRNPLRPVLIGYALALLGGVLGGLAGWQLILAFWLGGPVLVLAVAALPVLGMADGPAWARDERPPTPEPAPATADIASWDADLVAESLRGGVQAGRDAVAEAEATGASCAASPSPAPTCEPTKAESPPRTASG